MAKNHSASNNHQSATPGTMTGPSLRVQRANRFILDAQGNWHCTIATIAPQPTPDPTRPPRYRWSLEGPGTVRSWQLHFATPMELGEALDEIATDEPEEAQEVSAEEVQAPSTNTLAKVCLVLGLVTEEDLQPVNLDDTLDRLDLSAAIGLTVTCRVAKKNTAFIDGAMRPCNPYNTPVLESMALDQ